MHDYNGLFQYTSFKWQKKLVEPDYLKRTTEEICDSGHSGNIAIKESTFFSNKHGTTTFQQ